MNRDPLTGSEDADEYLEESRGKKKKPFKKLQKE
jgi:hypothetical protein